VPTGSLAHYNKVFLRCVFDLPVYFTPSTDVLLLPFKPIVFIPYF